MGLSKTAVYWSFQLIGWFVYALAQSLLVTLDEQSIDRMWLTGEGLQLATNILLTHGFRYVIIRFRWLNFKLVKIIPLVLIAVLLMSFLSGIVWMLILAIQNGFNLGDAPAEAIAGAIFVALLESLFLYSIWSSAYLIFLYFERYNKSLKYEASTREIELKNLKSQLNPHFIFNALNSIRALVDENPAKSKESITQLSNILRNSLNSDRKKLVPFAEELKIVKDYLGLESIRYEERLQTEIDLVEGTSDFQVPPLMLQTLVENGIKHGIARKTKGGKISIKSRVQEDGLLIAIRNSGQYKPSGSSKGFGLENTRKRLDMIYGEEASLSIANENKETVLTQIKIPK